MKFKALIIVLLAIGLLFVSACTTGQSYNVPQQYGGGGCGASSNPVSVVKNTLAAAVEGNGGGC